MKTKKSGHEKKNNIKIQKTNKGVINNAGKVISEKITDTLEKNYMPYAMSVIMSRAIPEIDGFKPAHRKLLYTMYKMGLLGSIRTKSANIVGQTMKLNPHGDSAIYDTMARMTKAYEALLHPYVDSKGNFGKFYSRDMACAASRYTEAKLSDICHELFQDIDKDTVEFVDNYDNTLKEPRLLPVSYPSILVNTTTGIAVGMASSICSFNLREICQTTINIIKNPDFDVSQTLLAPDFPGGAKIIYDKEKLQEIYDTGRGGIKVRAKYLYDKSANRIEINQIPPTTTSELIIEKIIDLVKLGKIKEISDVRDETGIEGLKIAIDLKRGINPDIFMNKLYKLTPLEDTFSCNFNVLINGVPKVLGIKDLINEWLDFRTNCIIRRTKFDVNQKQDKLHLLKGLEKILLDIDRAIKIIKDTEKEVDVIPNLMEEFSIDELQADFIAEIKLKYLNKEYILKRISEIKQLESDIKKLNDILSSKEKLQNIIISELSKISETYGMPRKSELIYLEQIQNIVVENQEKDYNVTYFFTQDGYLKKITPQSLRMSSEQKLKDGDKIIQTVNATNQSDILFFTDKKQVYKSKGTNFQDLKASVLGEYISAVINMDKDELPIYMAVTSDYEGFMLFCFSDGKIAKVSMKSYQTKTNRKKLINAYSDKSNIVKCLYLKSDSDIIIKSSIGKSLIINTSQINIKTTKNTQGVQVMRLRKGHRVIDIDIYKSGTFDDDEKYKVKNLPASGFLIKEIYTIGEQLKI